MKDEITTDPTLTNNLDHWYGGPKKVGIRDIIVGLPFIAVIVLTMVVYQAAKDIRQATHTDPHVTCPQCGHKFIPENAPVQK